MLRQGLLLLSESNLARLFMTHAPFARTAARRFVAGETVDDVVAATRELNDAGIKVTVDYLGESVSSRDEARAAADVYIDVLDRIADDELDANVSLKLTQMGLDIDDGFVRDNLGRVLDHAREHGIFVRIDMESSDYTQRTLDVFEHFWAGGYRNTGIVLQSYLYRSEADARRANELGARVRLCKGAYNEPASVAFQAKSDVDAKYVALMRLLLDGGHHPAIATHDEAMIRATLEHVRAHDIPVSAFEFQMLYGIRRDLQARLVEQGYTLRAYVPFGGAWYPYLMRRMAERPANFFFIANAIVRESRLGRILGNHRG